MASMMVVSRWQPGLPRALAMVANGLGSTMYGDGMVVAAKAGHVVCMSVTVLQRAR
jgi:hypothetical protein